MSCLLRAVLLVSGLAVASIGKAVIADGRSDRVLYVEKRDRLTYFHRCTQLEGVISSCTAINPDDGLTLADFQPLLDTLQHKSDVAAVSNARINVLTFALIGSTALSSLLLVRSLHKRNIVRLLGGGCCGSHRHSHNLWHSVRAAMPKIRPRQLMRYLFKEKNWIMPSILAQSSAAIASYSSAENAADKLAVYQFLHSEVMNIGTLDSNHTVLQVRSVATIEFMIYEAIRLKRQAHEEQASTSR
ncbi:MAG: hypothetical protein OYH77_07790 [Pseudomonadota bacterium]|nr:hypothetical protein [Pseudomonadota bacterium]